jgi:phosphatidate cytidylyltransferase
MVAAEPGTASAPAAPAASAGGRSNLASRVIVGVFLAVVAIADIWVGGPVFTLMIAVGVGLVLWEWCAMHAIPLPWRLAGLAVLAGASGLAQAGLVLQALALLGAAILVFLPLSALARTAGKRWLSTGLLYAGLPAVALIWLRNQPDGFALVMWTMGLVWATDIFAYFAGRSIGGPKIWPAVSPNKTWAGLLGGMAAAALFSVVFAGVGNWSQSAITMALVGALLAVVAQAGDFLESWLKRRAGVKDSGTLLRGHGGVMDRVDGLVPVCVVVALWVGLQTPAQLVLASTEAFA